MSMWQQIQKLPDELQKRVQQLYNGEHFPVEVRSVLSSWIENQPWAKIEYDNPEHEKFAANLVTALIHELNRFALTIENATLKFRLEQVAQNFHHNYTHDPINLVRIVNHCLNNESKILQSAQNYLSDMDTKPIIRDAYHEIYPELSKLRTLVTESDQMLRRLNQDQESLILHYQDRTKVAAMAAQANHSNPERSKLIKNLETIDSSLRTESDNVMKDRAVLVERYRETLNRLSVLQTTVLDTELERWRRGQQLAGNGVAYEGFSLEEIQEWCEGLAELIWNVRVQIKRLQIMCQNYAAPQYITDSLFGLLDLTTQMLHRLVKSTFIIEKQPPQVMKTNTRFTATVRLLVGGKLNVHMTPPSVTVFIVSEHQVNMLGAEQANLILPHNESAAGEILNNTGIMEYHSATRQLSVHFRNMQLKKIKRTEKKGTESVMDEKFSLLFFSRFNVCGGDLGDILVRVSNFSLPVVVIVHGNQEPHAHATITWDNAFAEPGRASFTVPDKVPFIRVGEVLSQKFIHSVGYGLTEDNLRFLAAKALRTSSVPDLNTLISWSQFSKEPLPERNFTFWEWFYAILKVTKEHLRSLWNDKTIIGFIWRKQAEEMLASCQPGTFLLRFSDSELGGLTVAWKAKSNDGTADEYYMLQPFTSRDFQIRGLADRLNDLKHLVYLYPDISKELAFSKYYTPLGDNSKTVAGYVKPYLVTCVPGLSGPTGFDSYPNTPQSSMHPQSPSDTSSMHFEPSNSQLEAAGCTPV
ncbi:PREDICTED: signal transducer and activator of transcription 5B-like, partial [Rhagoletis zephyria]|uniref:signal transducer and activator of transcription 5B-like n=1 Tax=Rhagoletis zephyria TaxID=28612 RepID=UPI000811436E